MKLVQEYFEEFVKSQYDLKWNLLRCVKIDDDKNMYGVEKDQVGYIYKPCENIKYLKLMVIHCVVSRYFVGNI